MSNEIVRWLDSAARPPTTPIQPEAVYARGLRRRWARRVAGGVGAASVLALAAVTIGWLPSPTSAPVIDQPSEATPTPGASTGAPATPTDSDLPSPSVTAPIASEQPAPGPQQPIFVTMGGAVLGWFADGEWIQPDPSGEVPPAIVGIELRSLDGSTTTVSEQPIVTCFPEDDFGSWHLGGGFSGLMVAGDHRLQPRPVRSRQPTSADRASVQAALDELDVDAEVTIQDVHVVDLEGDGRDEAIIVATNVDADQPFVGLSDDHYSIVLLRRLRPDDSVEVVTVHSERAPGADAGANSITVEDVEAIADLNGDGRYEVVASYQGYEWGGVSVYDLMTPEPTWLIGAGCGV